MQALRSLTLGNAFQQLKSISLFPSAPSPFRLSWPVKNALTAVSRPLKNVPSKSQK